MFQRFNKGCYGARVAETEAELSAILALRAQVFRGDRAACDRDRFDAQCRHVMVEDLSSGAVLCAFRLLHMADGRDVARSYAAQFYDLTGLQSYGAPLVEVGRFCVAPEVADQDILRVAWGAVTAYVAAQKVEMLFGCSSFEGVDAAPYHAAFTLLKDRHLAPDFQESFLDDGNPAIFGVDFDLDWVLDGPVHPPDSLLHLLYPQDALHDSPSDRDQY